MNGFSVRFALFPVAVIASLGNDQGRDEEPDGPV